MASSTKTVFPNREVPKKKCPLPSSRVYALRGVCKKYFPPCNVVNHFGILYILCDNCLVIFFSLKCSTYFYTQHTEF